MEKLNFIKQWTAFEARRQGKLKAQAVTLYMSLFGLGNEASYEGGVNQIVYADNERLMKKSGIGNEKTLRSHRDELIKQGFIEYQRGGEIRNGRRVVGRYKLIRLY